METPLRGRSGGHAGTAPTVSFGFCARMSPLRFRLGRLRMKRLISFGWIACKWLFCLCGIAWQNMMKLGRGRCLCARPCRPTRAHPSFNPRAQCVYFWYGNAVARTFGRANRHRPYGFVWWIVCGWFCLLVGKTVHKNQHHRCCTFVSPGLPTIGGYPG